MIHLLLSLTKKPVFSSNSEASTSDLLENVGEMFPQCDMYVMFKSTTTHKCVTRRERVNMTISILLVVYISTTNSEQETEM